MLISIILKNCTLPYFPAELDLHTACREGVHSSPEPPWRDRVLPGLWPMPSKAHQLLLCVWWGSKRHSSRAEADSGALWRLGQVGEAPFPHWEHLEEIWLPDLWGFLLKTFRVMKLIASLSQPCPCCVIFVCSFYLRGDWAVKGKDKDSKAEAQVAGHWAMQSGLSKDSFHIAVLLSTTAETIKQTWAEK